MPGFFMAGLYSTPAWYKLRTAQLRDEPTCRMCGQRATVADHIKPHRGDLQLFHDPANLQSLCKRCHDSTKQRQEKRPSAGCALDGMPSDATHHWRR